MEEEEQRKRMNKSPDSERQRYQWRQQWWRGRNLAKLEKVKYIPEPEHVAQEWERVKILILEVVAKVCD